MNKPVVFILAGGLVLGLIGAGVYLYTSRNPASAPTPIATISAAPTPTPKLVPWDDPAGFTLSYPEGLTVNKHDEDKVNYAHVEMTDANHPGSLTVWVKDLSKGITDTKSWATRVSTPSSAISFDTTLGGKDAQKILVSSPEKVVSVGLVYDDVVWVVEARLTDEPFWQSVYDAVTQSFAFKPLPGSNSQGGGTTEVQTNVDEEEVLE